MKKIIIFIISFIILLVVLFMPQPYYISTQPSCKPCPDPGQTDILFICECPHQGWNWTESFFERLLANIRSSNKVPIKTYVVD